MSRPANSYRGARRNEARHLGAHHTHGVGALRFWREGPHYDIPHNTTREITGKDPTTGLFFRKVVDFIAIQVVHSTYVLTTRAKVA